LFADDFNYHSLDALVDTHDDSKYSNEEFYGYRYQFYPEDDDGLTAETRHSYFDSAWNHHQKANPHHWQYWVMVWGRELKPLPMPAFYIWEMLMDWTAMSLTVGHQKPSEWYVKQKAKMVIAQATSEAIEHWLPAFDEIYTELKEGSK
jgi:hypothetical protein